MKLFFNNSCKSIFLLTSMVILLAGVSLVKSDSVCTLKNLRMEIREDLADNGMLDCLRKIHAPHNYIETEEEKNKRIMAQWDSSCSFEASTDIKNILKREFGISTLVDSNGEPVSSDFEDQVDMCEIIRAAIANGDMGKDIQMRKIPDDVVNKIDCAGPLGDRDGPKICAATSGSFYNKAAWNIFLNSPVIRLAGKPTFTQKQIEEDNEKEDVSLSDKMKNLLSSTKDRFAGLTGKLYNKIKGSGISDPIVKESDIHFYKLHDNNITLQSTAQSGDAFRRIDSAAVEINSIKSGVSYSMFAFFMISTDTVESSCEFRMNLNGNQVSETRANFKSMKNAAVSAATIYNISNSVNNNAFTLEYRSNKLVEVPLIKQTGTTSFAVEAALWPQENIFKFVNSEDFEIKGSSTFTAMVDEKNRNNKIELVVNNDKAEARNYIVTYNVAAKLNNEVTSFGTVLRGGNEVEWNTINYSEGKSIANHAAKVVTIAPGESKTYSLDYVMVGNSDTIKMENNVQNNSVVALNAIELPKIAKFEVFEPSEVVDLTAQTQQFKPLHVKATKTYSEKTKVMILFHVNIKMADASQFITKITVNDTKSQRSIMSWFGSKYASGQGYVLHEFDKGNYDIQLMYFGKGDSSLEKNNSNIENNEIKQAVEMTIIEFN
jgi:hypothetical protein